MMIIKCINDKCTTNGLTLNKEYEVMSIEDSCGILYKIIDDNGHIKKYSESFFYTKINQFEDKINSFSELQKNWDSYKANEISPYAIKIALKTVRMLHDNNVLSDNVSVFPMRDGGIQFEFGNDYELEINTKGDLILIEIVNDKIVDITIGSNISEVINKIKL